MPRYMFVFRDVNEGAKAVSVNSRRLQRAAIVKAVADLGGRPERLRSSFGDDKVYTICELPSNAAAASIGSILGLAYLVRVRTIALPNPPRHVDYLTRSVAESPAAPQREGRAALSR